jgi:ABC-type uncharacterized transport system permease subunit
VLEFKNEAAGVIRLAQSFNDVIDTLMLNNFHGYVLTDYLLFVIHHVSEELSPMPHQQFYHLIQL